jgi:uncharacterized RDD family membrane protein YckC
LDRRTPYPTVTLPPDRLDAPVTPDMLEGVIWRRVLAYLVDLIIIGCIEGLLILLVFVPASVVTLGLLSAPLWAALALIPFAYHVLLIGGRHSATLGQRLFDLRVMDMSGAKPDYIQAALMTALFYITLMLTGLLLFFVFFNSQHRALHDWLSGTIVVRRRGFAS